MKELSPTHFFGAYKILTLIPLKQYYYKNILVFFIISSF